MGVESAPRLILRSAGFPFDLLEGVGDPAAQERALAVARCEDEVARAAAAARRALDGLGREVVGRPERRKLKKALAGSGAVDAEGLPEALARPVEERNAAVAALAAATERLAESAPRAEERAARALAGLAADPAFEEAVWLSSPSAWDGIRRLGPQTKGTKQRQRYRLAASYLQRLSAKNETAAFFGPTNFGVVAPLDGRDRRSWLRYETGPARVERRHVEVARHVVEALADAAAREPDIAAELPLGLHPLARVDEAGALWVGDRRLGLAADIVARIRDLGGQPRAAWDEALGSRAVQRLADAGVLTGSLRPPETSLADLADLDRRLRSCTAASAGRWAERIERLRAVADETARSPWPRRRSGYAEAEALLDEWGVDRGARSAGALYTDRAVFFEEATGGVRDLRVDAEAILGDNPGLEAILRAHGAYAREVRRDARDWIGELWQAAGLPDDVPLGGLLLALADDLPAFAPSGWSSRAEALWADLAGLVDPDARRVDLAADAVLERVGDRLPDEPFLCSPDLMLASTGPARDAVVLSEVHHGVQVAGFLLRFAPEGVTEELGATLRDWAKRLGQGHRLATLLDPRMTGKTHTLEYPGVTVERSARSVKAREDVRDLWGVRAQRDGDDLRLADGDGPLLLAPTSPVDPVVRAFGALVLWGPRHLPYDRHLPRVSVDGTVWFRESWRLPAEELRASASDGDAAMLRAAGRLRHREGLPRWVFVRCASEPKPVLADLTSAASLELLRSLALANEELIATEMLPGADDLWLRWGSRRYTSELRMSMLVEADP